MNLARQLVLVCEICDWEPSKEDKQVDILMHNKVEHDIDEDVRLLMVPKCTCGVLMRSTGGVSETGGGTKAYFVCPDCTATGFIKQEDYE